MSNQSPCTDPPYPCTALTLAEKSAVLDDLTRLLHRRGGSGESRNPRPAQGGDGG